MELGKSTKYSSRLLLKFWVASRIINILKGWGTRKLRDLHLNRSQEQKKNESKMKEKKRPQSKKNDIFMSYKNFEVPFVLILDGIIAWCLSVY